MNLTTHLHLMSGLRMGVRISPLPLYVFVVCTGKILPFTVFIVFHRFDECSLFPVRQRNTQHHFTFQRSVVIKESYCLLFSDFCCMKITIHWGKFQFTWMPSLILFCGFLNILCEVAQLVTHYK